ncbi:hypothetical protein [Nostoc sp.]|uniref:hypothetical protein n=1 Tax=Nostoc sp. TaxID=1180 RepID=UPI002FF7D19F
MLNPNMVRVYETEALGTVLPMSITLQLGLRIRGQQIAEYANRSEESIGLTEPVIIELTGRETTEATLVTVQYAWVKAKNLNLRRLGSHCVAYFSPVVRS